jgi:hypothetical protein
VLDDRACCLVDVAITIGDQVRELCSQAAKLAELRIDEPKLRDGSGMSLRRW